MPESRHRRVATATFITNALHVDWLCMLVRTSGEGGYQGISQIIVPTATPGFEAKLLEKLGMHASDTGVVTLDDVRVPLSNTIGDIDRGFQQQMSQFGP